MKQILLIFAVVALVGCGNQPGEKDVVGEYGKAHARVSYKMILHENGLSEFYKKISKDLAHADGRVDGKWNIQFYKNKDILNDMYEYEREEWYEVHVEINDLKGEALGTTWVWRIESDGGLTFCASIKNGKRVIRRNLVSAGVPLNDQVYYKKIKSMPPFFTIKDREKIWDRLTPGEKALRCLEGSYEADQWTLESLNADTAKIVLFRNGEGEMHSDGLNGKPNVITKFKCIVHPKTKELHAKFNDDHYKIFKYTLRSRFGMYNGKLQWMAEINSGKRTEVRGPNRLHPQHRVVSPRELDGLSGLLKFPRVPKVYSDTGWRFPIDDAGRFRNCGG